ncbi:MAG: hypothetical protein WCK21_09030, partial [Actinomycetota bacterium]
MIEARGKTGPGIGERRTGERQVKTRLIVLRRLRHGGIGLSQAGKLDGRGEVEVRRPANPG